MACWTVRMSLDTEENTSNRTKESRITTDFTGQQLEKTVTCFFIFVQ